MKTHKSLRAVLAAILAAFMALAVFPFAAITPAKADAYRPEEASLIGSEEAAQAESAQKPDLTAEKEPNEPAEKAVEQPKANPIQPTWTVPEGYNANDYYKCLALLEGIEEWECSEYAGMKRGEVLFENYDPEDPQTWHGGGYSDWDGEEIGFFFTRGYSEYYLSSVNIYGAGFSGVLDLSGCYRLRSLDCSFNGFTELNLSQCWDLRSLFCPFNSLSELELSGCNIYYLLCEGNPLTRISGIYELLLCEVRAEGFGYISLTHWHGDGSLYASPRHGYEEYFLGWYTEDGELISDELELMLSEIWDPWEWEIYYDCDEIIAKFVTLQDAYDMHDYNKVIAFLEQTDENGVKNGVKLNPKYDPDDPDSLRLAHWSNANYGITDGKYHLISFDISGVPWQTVDELHGFIDLSGCEYLSKVEVGENVGGSGTSGKRPITGIDVSGCGRLGELICRSSQVEEIVLSGCSSLVRLNCGYNRISEIDLSDCRNLSYFFIEGNSIREIDLTPCKSSLYNLWIGATSITELDLSGYTNLKFLNTAYARKLARLNISGCSSLVQLYSIYNGLEQFDCSGCTALEEINLLATFGTGPTKLDFSDCPNLKYLQTNSCLTELNISTAAGIYHNSVRALGNGTFYFYSDGNHTKICAYAGNGSYFLGWYNEAGELLSNSCDYTDHADKVIIARFSGWIELSAPASISAALNSAKRPVITWSAVEDAEGYEVWRRAADGESELIAAVNGTEFIDESELAGFTKYYYKVRAVAAGTEGPFSDEAMITAYGLRAPGGVRVSLIDRKPTLTWNAAANATSYEIYRSTSKDGEFALIAAVSGTSYTDTDELLPLTKYYYKLKALDSIGFESPLSAAVYVTAYGIKAPTGVNAQLIQTKPTVTWSAAANATRYEIYRSTAKDGEYALIGETTELNFTDNDALEAFARYYYKVKALDDFGFESLLSAAANITAYGVKTPAGVKAQLVDTKPTITWNAATNATHYEIYRSTTGTGEFELIGETTELNFTDNDELVGFKRYYYKVKALDDFGNESALSAAASIIAYGIKAPAGVKAQLVDTKPTITWNAAANAAYYTVYRSNAKDGEYALIGETTELSFTDNDELEAQQRYYYKVKGNDDFGNESPFSVAVNVVAYGVKTPAGVKVKIVETKPTITWNAAANATHYEIYRSTTGTGEFELIGETTELSFTDNDELVPFDRYYYKVKAFDDHGNESQFSAVVNTLAYGIKKPARVKAQLVDGKPVITWNAAANATAYEIYRSTTGTGEYELIGTTAELSFTDESELMPNQRYYYKVKGIDDNGNSSEFSAAATVVAPSIAAPTGLSIMLAGNMPVVTWTAVNGAANYQVWRSSGADFELVSTGNATGYVDTASLTPGQTYSYKVCAIDASGAVSAFSETVTIVIPG